MRFKLQDVEDRRKANIEFAKKLGREAAQDFASNGGEIAYLMQNVQSELERANIFVGSSVDYNNENTAVASMKIPLPVKWSQSITSAIRLTRYPRHFLDEVKAGLDALLKEQCEGKLIKLHYEEGSACVIEVEIPLY